MAHELEVDQFVLPGTDLVEFIQKQSGHKKQITIGPGVRKVNHQLLTCRGGRLRFERNPDRVWVDSVQKRYLATKGERVVGTVLSNRGSQLKIDIGTAEYAILDVLAFEGATKKNRPDIKVGDLVFGQLLVAAKDIESEMVCITSKGKKDGMGILPPGGFMFTVPVHVARQLLHPGNKLLQNLGSRFKFECAIGMNGRIWIKSSSIASTIYIVNAIKQITHLNEQQMQQHCDSVLETFVMIK